MLVPRTRVQDIELRGKNRIVSDYNGSPIKLVNAQIWYTNDGKYVEPVDYDENNVRQQDSCCFSLFDIFNHTDTFL